MEFVFTKDLEKVFRRLDARQRKALSWWSERLYGRCLSGESFCGGTFYLFDSIAKKCVIVKLGNFAISVDTEDKLVERQLFKMSEMTAGTLDAIPMEEGKLYTSQKLGNLMLRWMGGGDFRQARIDEMDRERCGVTA